MEVKIPTRDEIANCFISANLGGADPVWLVKTGLLKIACGYSTGHTVECALKGLGLIGRTYATRPRLTKDGGFVLYEWFGRIPEPAASQADAGKEK